MQGIYKSITYFLILLHGCFAGVFLGQLLSLVYYSQPVSWVIYPAIILIASLTILFFYPQAIQSYLLRHFSFVWNHFFSSIYSFALLLLLLPVFFNFEESGWIVASFQLSSLVALLLLLLDYQFLQHGLLQKAYAGLLKIPQKAPFLFHLTFLLSMAALAYLTSGFYTREEYSLTAILQLSLFIGAGLFLVSAALKWALFRMLNAWQRCPIAVYSGQEQKTDNYSPGEQHYLFLAQNLEEIILETAEENRPLVYEKIREIPLIDKIAELSNIQDKHLPNDGDLAHTLGFLRNLRQELPAGEDFNDLDHSTKVIIIKACIRTVIVKQRPMLVQKLLTDPRPEVRKAAMLATVSFQEASFIPALVDLLKEHEFSFTAKQALRDWGEQCIPFLRSAKYRNKKDRFFIEQCLEIVDSFKSPEARDFLVEMLNEPQKQFQYKAALALLKNDYALSALHKTQILHFIDSLIATIIILREIRCSLAEVNNQLYTALLEEERDKKTFVIALLKAFLPGTVWLVFKKELERPDQDRVILCALIDLFFPLVLRKKCKIVFSTSEEEPIGLALQPEYLQDQVYFKYEGEQAAVEQVLKLDYNLIGSWLRVCALKQLARMPGQQASLQIQGEVFNENPLLQEVAAEVLYTLNYDYYFLYMQRLPPERAKLLKYKIETRMSFDPRVSQQNAHLLSDQILFLRSLSLFKDCPYQILASNIRFYSVLTIEKTDSALQEDPYKPVGYWVIYKGAFSVFYRGEVLFEAGRGDVIDMSFLSEAEDNALSIRSEDEIKIYFIEKFIFNKLYLKTGYFKNQLLQPILYQSNQLHVA